MACRKVKCRECMHKDKNGRGEPCCKCREIMGSKYENLFIQRDEE